MERCASLGELASKERGVLVCCGEFIRHFCNLYVMCGVGMDIAENHILSFAKKLTGHNIDKIGFCMETQLD